MTTEALKALDSDGIVIVEFRYTDCPPCKVLKPLLKKVSREKQIPVVMVDLDEKRFDKVSDNYGVTRTPTVIVVKDGVEVARGVVHTELGLRRLVSKAERA